MGAKVIGNAAYWRNRTEEAEARLAAAENELGEEMLRATENGRIAQTLHDRLAAAENVVEAASDPGLMTALDTKAADGLREALAAYDAHKQNATEGDKQA